MTTYIVDICYHKETTYEIEAESEEEAIEEVQAGEGRYLHEDNTELCHETAVEK